MAAPSSAHEDSHTKEELQPASGHKVDLNKEDLAATSGGGVSSREDRTKEELAAPRGH